jgi:methylase of polypeptide subunit release factors
MQAIPLVPYAATLVPDRTETRQRVVDALVATGSWLQTEGYRFGTVTPATQARVVSRRMEARALSDVFGWNRPFTESLLPRTVLADLQEAGLDEREPVGWRSVVRFSSLGRALYAHGGFPTTGRRAVFFGPDSHRFAAELRRHVPRCDVLVDVGCGSGVGGLEVSDRARRVVLADLNRRALVFAEANALLAGVSHVTVQRSDLLSNVAEQPDVIVANPPYLVDPRHRIYRDGGGDRGVALAQRIVTQSLRRLAPHGKLVLYTGTPVVEGVDQFRERIEPILSHVAADVEYEEIDPDVFGEELEQATYGDVDRIAVVLLRISLRDEPLRSHAPGGSMPTAAPTPIPTTPRERPPTDGPPEISHTLHLELARHLDRRLTPTVGDPGATSAEREAEADEWISEFLRTERSRAARNAAEAPDDADAFVAWFSELDATGPGQHDPLFEWLAEHADLEQFRWFLAQELAGEAGFDDLLALTQVKMPARPKMEMARNLWDEFGRGKPKAVHGTLLSRIGNDLAIESDPEAVGWQALALGNLMAGMALDRRYAYHSVGALGVIELTAPGRVARVNDGLRRLGVRSETRRYFELHAALDVEHSAAWNREVLHPLVAADPKLAAPIAEGALMRLEAGRRCFDAYRAHFRLAA